MIPCKLILYRTHLLFLIALITFLHASQGAERVPVIDIIHTDLHISVSAENSSLRGEVHYQAVIQAAIDEEPLIMNAYWLAIDSIAVNGSEAYGVFLPIQGIEYFGISFPEDADLAPGDTVILSIWYRRIVEPGEPGREPLRQGYYFFEKGDGNWNQTASETIAYTMSQPNDARAWFPTIDEPWNKSKLTMHITVDSPVAVIANGTLIEKITNDDGSVTYSYDHPYPVSPYLFAFNVGPYEEHEDFYESKDGRTIPVSSYLFEADASRADPANSMMKNMMAVFEDLFGPYPFDRYGMIAVEPFPYGGMEHQTITTMRRQLFLSERVTAHELAHQWWGNMVTCKSWRHIWLNEGFATYSEALYTEQKDGLFIRDVVMQGFARIYFAEDEVNRYALFDPDEKDLFGRAIYYKGAWVLHMLRSVTGDDAFFRALREYAGQHAYSVAGTDDLLRVFEEEAGMELGWFFDQWVYGAGYPVYDIESRIKPAEGASGYDVRVNLAQVQENAPTVFGGPVEFLVKSEANDTVLTFWNDQREQQFIFTTTEYPDTVIFDPGNKILKKIGKAMYVDGKKGIPEKISLLQNYPNPFNTSTTIAFRLPEASHVRIRIIDMLGRNLLMLVDDRYERGEHTVMFNAEEYASGVFFAVMEAGDANLVRKMLYIK